MKRLYFLVPDIHRANRIAQELTIASFDTGQMQVICAKDILSQASEIQSKIPKANLLQSSDFYPAIGRGIPLGGCVGLLLGIVISMLNPEYAKHITLVLITGAVAGSLWGAWVSGIVGIALPNSKLEPFSAELAQGAVVLLVQVANTQAKLCTDLVAEKYPYACSTIPDMYDLLAIQ